MTAYYRFKSANQLGHWLPESCIVKIIRCGQQINVHPRNVLPGDLGKHQINGQDIFELIPITDIEVKTKT